MDARSAKSEKSRLFGRDVPAWYADEVRAARRVAWDIETSGLDWQSDRVATCQLCVPGSRAVVVQIGDAVPQELARLLADGTVLKVFHHAVFDLRFMCHSWQVRPTAIECTKVAAKLLYPGSGRETSLQRLLAEHLGVEIDKGQRLSDWMTPVLTNEQLDYAEQDVVHLFSLLDALKCELRARRLLKLAKECFRHIPARVRLEIEAFGDVFSY